MSRIGLSISSLFILALLVYLPSWLEEEQQPLQDTQEDAWRPNYQARNLRSSLFDQDGRISHRIVAQSMKHYDLLGFTVFQLPEYTFYFHDGQQPWTVTAEKGTLYENNRILLEQDVRITNLNNADVVQSIRTEFIEFDLTEKTMTSDQPVEIQGLDFVINSNGFQANMETKQYELLDHVQTLYAPRS